MTISILNDVWLMKDSPLSKIRDYFMSFQMDVFEEYFEKTPHTDTEKKWAVLFALLAFDQQSPLVVTKQDAIMEKQKVCQHIGVAEYFVPNLVELKDKDFRSAVTSYLIRYAGELFRDLCFKKIQLIDFEIMITNKDFGKVTGKDDSVKYEYGVKEHHEAIKMKNMLSRDIEKLESELISRTRLIGIESIKRQLEDMQKRTNVGGSFRGAPENFVVGK